jgi:1,2-diacylglycerol 3-beta-galactosyltransferase
MFKILILFSDTGGGHRAAAEALRDSLDQEHGSRCQTVLEDAIVKGAAWPFNFTPKTYLPITKHAARAWGEGFKLANSRLGARLLGALAYTIGAKGLRRILLSNDPDMVVTVHPLITYAPWRVWSVIKPGAPFVTVVTDLFDAHVTWFSAHSDLTVVPTEGARQHGLHWGFPAARMRVVGLPVSRKFAESARHPLAFDSGALSELRRRLGLLSDVFTLLIVGGGEGMGAIEEIALALDASGLPIQLAIIAGRNTSLQRRLENERWAVPVRVTGFVTDMPDWMNASNVVVTKAGPGTIMEALAVGRPILLSGYVPGQEKGNVDYVEQSGVGVFRDTPAKIVDQVRKWMTPGDGSLEKMSERARAEARPEAAFEIANLLLGLLERDYEAQRGST